MPLRRKPAWLLAALLLPGCALSPLPSEWSSATPPAAPERAAAAPPTRAAVARIRPVEPVARAPQPQEASSRPAARPADPAVSRPDYSAAAPKIGSPEWERERAYSDRREREIERSMKICSGC